MVAIARNALDPGRCARGSGLDGRGYPRSGHATAIEIFKDDLHPDDVRRVKDFHYRTRDVVDALRTEEVRP
jgi:hypothetical protein